MAKKTKELFQQELIKNGTKKAITTEIKIETEFFYAEGKSQTFIILYSLHYFFEQKLYGVVRSKYSLYSTDRTSIN